MNTVVHCPEKEVQIKSDGRITIIGEKINPTGNKKLARSLADKDFEYVQKLAISQVAAGAHILDVNAGAPGVDEVRMLPQIVKLVSETVQVPICIDSNDPKALEAALKVIQGKALINSVNGERSKLDTILPLVKEYNTAVIALTLDNDGIPKEAEKRFAIAAKIIEEAARIGIKLDDIVLDPLVLTVGADQNAALVTLDTIRLIRKEFNLNINLGASNISFGLPDRQTINQAFLAFAIFAGASCVITDPEKLSSTILACDLLLGRDRNGKNYLNHVRSK